MERVPARRRERVACTVGGRLAGRARDRPGVRLQGSEATHGAPLGEDEIAAARARLGWSEPPFVVPDAIREAWDATEKGARLEAEWRELMEGYRAAHPDLAGEFARRMDGTLPPDWPAFADRVIAQIDASPSKKATRKASLDALNGYAPALPELIGGSADLTGSNCTKHANASAVTRESTG